MLVTLRVGIPHLLRWEVKGRHDLIDLSLIHIKHAIKNGGQASDSRHALAKSTCLAHFKTGISHGLEEAYLVALQPEARRRWRDVDC